MSRALSESPPRRGGGTNVYWNVAGWVRPHVDSVVALSTLNASVCVSGPFVPLASKAPNRKGTATAPLRHPAGTKPQDPTPQEHGSCTPSKQLFSNFYPPARAQP